ncbi:MAG: aminopeptidase, partial [Oscillospiraceae bacterium]|nr:aminopeptidase [Oscillospiraceae bacterium]
MVPNFEAKLNEYAHLLVEVGLNLQPGQTPHINSEVSCAPLTRLCVAACYEKGAREVVVSWRDEVCTRERYLHAHEDVFSEFPGYMKDKYQWMLDKGCPNLSVIGEDPEMLKGVDPGRIRAAQLAAVEPTKPWYDAMMASRFPWSIGAYPTRSWAEKVFPDKKGEEAVDALWDAIFSVCRINGDGKGVERWKEHVENTARRSKLLNDYNFKTLHYTNSLGTDLTVTLPEDHVWAGGAEVSGDEGIPFVANIPTEEIFTAPRWDGV